MVFHHSNRHQWHHCPQPLPLLSSQPFHPFPFNFEKEITSFLSLSSLLCEVCVLRLGSSLVCSQPTRGPIIKENRLSLPPPLSYANSSSASGGITSPPSPPFTGVFLELEFTQVLCMLLKSLWVHMCLCPACVWTMVSLTLSILLRLLQNFPFPLSQRPLSLSGEGCNMNVQFKAEHSAHWLVVGEGRLG